MIHDSGYRVRNAEHVASCELAVGSAGVYQAGSVREELPIAHDRCHVAIERFAFVSVRLRGRDVGNDAVNDRVPILEGLALAVFGGVALGSDLAGVEG